MKFGANKSLILGTSIVVALGAGVASWNFVNASSGDRVTICHATKSASNPYTLITVDRASVDNIPNRLNGHGTHTGPLFDPQGGQKQPPWGDIIPPITSPTNAANDFPGMNWPAGEPIWGIGCRVPIPTPTSTPTPTESPTPTPTPTESPTPTPTPTPTPAPPAPGPAPVTPSVPDVVVEPSAPQAPSGDDSVPVEIADPGATPVEPGEGVSDVEIASPPTQAQARPVPTSVPAGGGAASRQR